jgi:23S rRNA (uridine2552-2'-O)-methyltransferase
LFVAQRRELHDHYFKKAKAEGYAARSAYKLIQINERRPVIRAGDRVLDLGCAPGSWLQVAAELVGPKGSVTGLDLQAVTIELPVNVRTLVGDAFKMDPEVLTLGQPFDVVISDMAPNTSGAGSGDHLRSVALCRRVLEILPGVLRPGGHLVMKVFEGEAYPALLRETGAVFMQVRGYKPEATREVSREMYVTGLGYRAVVEGPAPPPRGHKGKPPEPRAGWGRE